ncbi:MAG: hypothetical protein ABH817_00345 [archaeon]
MIENESLQYIVFCKNTPEEMEKVLDREGFSGLHTPIGDGSEKVINDVVLTAFFTPISSSHLVCRQDQRYQDVRGLRLHLEELNAQTRRVRRDQKMTAGAFEEVKKVLGLDHGGTPLKDLIVYNSFTLHPVYVVK